MSFRWEIFISHASEDKEDVAKPLADALVQAGVKVWYDDLTLKLGDSLRRMIDRGLADSQYGVVILSPHFFSKEWPKRELDGLVTRETSTGKTILPIWHNVSREDVENFSPTLADKLSVSTDGGLPKVVKEILLVLNKDDKLKTGINTIRVVSPGTIEDVTNDRLRSANINTRKVFRNLYLTGFAAILGIALIIMSFLAVKNLKHAKPITKLLPQKPAVIASLPVGTMSFYPDSLMAIDPKGGSLFVASKKNEEHVVNTIDLITNSIGAAISLVREAEGLAVSPDSKFLYIILTVDYTSVKSVDQIVDNEIMVIQIGSNTLVRRLFVPIKQSRGRLTKAAVVGSQIYLTLLSMQSEVWVVNTLNGRVVKKIPIGTFPSDLILSPDNSKVYVSCDSMVYVIDTSALKVTKILRIYDPINQMAIDFVNGRLYAGLWDGGISIVDIYKDEIISKIAIHSWGLVLNPEGTKLYAVDNVKGILNIIDVKTATALTSVTLGELPKALIGKPDGSMLYAANTEDGTVSIIDTGSN